METFAYDAAGRVTSQIRRDGQVIAFVYDALGEVVKRDLPGTANDVTLSYDALGRVTAVSRNGAAISFSYDKASRLVQTVQAGLSVSYQYDAAGRRTRMTWPDGFYVTFGYDALGRVSEMRENGSALIASFAYDDQGRRTRISRGNGTTTSYAYDALGRLTRLTHDLAGTAADYDAEFTYDPLGRIVARTQANGLYHWPVATASGTASVNGLDQLASSGGTSLTYDGRGNLAGRGAWGYAHDVENNLTQVTGPVNLTLRYDALGRLERLIESGQDTRFLWDGAQVIGELDAASGAVKRRYVPGPGTNEVVAWYEGAGVGERRFIHQDERGSVVAVTNGAGAAIATFRYGPWGESSDTAPGSGAGTGFTRFGYTGAIRLPGTDLLHMRARVYATALARFLEPDPIGFASGQLNLYAYVGGDPINGVDPSGLLMVCTSVSDKFGTERRCRNILTRRELALQLFLETQRETQEFLGVLGEALRAVLLGALPGLLAMDPLKNAKVCASPSGGGVPRQDAESLDKLTRVILGEAAQLYKNPTIFKAIGSVVINRVRSEFFPNNVVDVVFQEGQFKAASPQVVQGKFGTGNAPFRNPEAEPGFLLARTIAEGLLSGEIGDVTGGALFFTADDTPPERLSSQPLGVVAVIGPFTFFCVVKK
ncbi:MAG: hypothetical protein KatS3mg119_1315 [Rhodothalassiaceae bacterium]|nr:MAG: hypothetical protein KatS3mg119_1315 [Rhodothalassiaceae bacterium]